MDTEYHDDLSRFLETSDAPVTRFGDFVPLHRRMRADAWIDLVDIVETERRRKFSVSPFQVLAREIASLGFEAREPTIMDVLSEEFEYLRQSMSTKENIDDICGYQEGHTLYTQPVNPI